MVGFFRQSLKLMFGKYLLLTNTATCYTLLSVGDIIQQTFGHRFVANQEASDFDSTRTRRVGNTALVLGPMNHYWYLLLDRKWAGRSAKYVFLKTFVDWLSCPAFSSTYFFAIAIQEGNDTMMEMIQEYASKYRHVITLDTLVWPPTQVINFYLLPPQLRVVYISTVQLLYNACMSYIKNDMVVDDIHDMEHHSHGV